MWEEITELDALSVPWNSIEFYGEWNAADNKATNVAYGDDINVDDLESGAKVNPLNS